MLSQSFRDGLKSESIAPKVEDGLESHQEKKFTVHILYQSVALVKENTMVYLFVH